MNFSRIKQLSFQQAVLLALFVVHGVWVVIHLSLVAQDRINPWKLGGYGMYTRPQPVSSYKIELLREATPADAALFEDIDYDSFYDKTMRTTFHCEPLNADAISEFFQDNSQLIGNGLKITSGTTLFRKNPIRLDYKELGSAEVEWVSAFEYQVSGKFCGDGFAFAGQMVK